MQNPLMKPKNNIKNIKNTPSVPKTDILSESTVVSTDFFFALVLSLGLGLAWLLMQNAQSISDQYAAIESPKAKAGNIALERRVKTLVKGFPIERMTPYISEQREETAAFIVGIAKKESNWGKRVPKKDGQDCFNYWGYRGGGDRVTWDGYTCFDSPKEAIETVGRRINTLVVEHELDTSREIVVWKCGWTCAGHNAAGVEKWIQDVDYYYHKVRPETDS